MKYWPIIVLCLSGCNQLVKPLLHSTTDVPTPNTQLTGTVLAMGQSNMQCAGHPSQTPAVAFQNAYPNVTVINCAIGGTSIYQWGLSQQLGDDCVVAWQHTSKPLVGILWYQGESDAVNGVTTWDQAFIALVASWRAKWGNVPIVYAQLATYDTATIVAPTWDLIKEQQANLRISNAMMVKTEDLPRANDLHLTGDAAMVVGQRMAKAFAQLKENL